MKTCPQCEKTFPDSEQFCDADGSQLVSAGAASPRAAQSAGGIACPVCGGKAEPGEVICNFCGARLDGQSGRPGAGLAPEPEPPEVTFEGDRPEEETPAGRRIFGTIGYTVAALAALGAGAWLAIHLSNQGKQPEKMAAQATPTAIASPAVTGPIAELADKIGVQVTGESASAPERDRAAASKIFSDNQSALLELYKRALAGDNSMHDGMLVRVRVMPTGEVASAAVLTSTAPNPSLDQETVKAIMGWHFTPFGGSAVEADYPIIYARSADDKGGIESALNDQLAHRNPAETPEYAFAVSTPLPTPQVVALPPAPASVAEPKPPRTPKSLLASLPKPKPSLLQMVQQRLAMNRKFSRVKAFTDQGRVTLYGKVFDDETKFAAERAARGVDGVTGVINTLSTDTSEWAQNESTIKQQLQNAGLDKVDVKVIGGDAYLSGEVGTDEEKQRAVTITEGAAPVTVRTNLITVVPHGLF
jgi:TonB family protein